MKKIEALEKRKLLVEETYSLREAATCARKAKRGQ